MHTLDVRFIDILNDAVAIHYFGVVVAFATSLRYIRLVSGGSIFQDPVNAMRVSVGAVAIGAGGHVSVTLGHLLAVDTMGKLAVLIFMALAAQFSLGDFVQG